MSQGAHKLLYLIYIHLHYVKLVATSVKFLSTFQKHAEGSPFLGLPWFD